MLYSKIQLPFGSGACQRQKKEYTLKIPLFRSGTFTFRWGIRSENIQIYGAIETRPLQNGEKCGECWFVFNS